MQHVHSEWHPVPLSLLEPPDAGPASVVLPYGVHVVHPTLPQLGFSLPGMMISTKKSRHPHTLFHAPSSIRGGATKSENRAYFFSTAREVLAISALDF
jgi:hypothetical protein